MLNSVAFRVKDDQKVVQFVIFSPSSRSSAFVCVRAAKNDFKNLSMGPEVYIDFSFYRKSRSMREHQMSDVGQVVKYCKI